MALIDMRPAIVIPVFNHGGNVAAVVRQALELHFPVIVVDDGSTDDTFQVVQSFAGYNEIALLHHRINQGKGAALLTGFALAAEKGCDYAVTIDADGQHNPQDAMSLLDAVKNKKKVLVVGRRKGMEGSKNVPWTSRFGRGFSNFWVFVSGGPWLTDTQSGFRLYPLPEVLDLQIAARRYQFEVEVLVKAKRQGIDIQEAPISVVYQARGKRISHFRPWIDFWRNAGTFTKLICIRIFGNLFS